MPEPLASSLVLAALRRNKQERDRAADEADKARAQLLTLVQQARAEAIPMFEIADATGLKRHTLYEILQNPDRGRPRGVV